ncbi:hypothetical protein D3C81_1368390 [compost metagenome]
MRLPVLHEQWQGGRIARRPGASRQRPVRPLRALRPGQVHAAREDLGRLAQGRRALERSHADQRALQPGHRAEEHPRAGRRGGRAEPPEGCQRHPGNAEHGGHGRHLRHHFRAGPVLAEPETGLPVSVDGGRRRPHGHLLGRAGPGAQPGDGRAAGRQERAVPRLPGHAPRGRSIVHLRRAGRLPYVPRLQWLPRSGRLRLCPGRYGRIVLRPLGQGRRSAGLAMLRAATPAGGR